MSGSVLSTIVLFVCVLAKTTKRSAEEKLHKMSQTSVRKEMVHIKLEMTEIGSGSGSRFIIVSK